MQINIVDLSAAHDAHHGGKASRLSKALQLGLPVPAGMVITLKAIETLTVDELSRFCDWGELLRTLGGCVVARSSASAEDSEDASFAGQFLTVVNIQSVDQLLQAIIDVFQSQDSAGVKGYMAHRSMCDRVAMSILIQRMVDPRSAGVLFSRHPVTGEDCFYIESAWGLGESVVGGLVTPDAFRMNRELVLLERTLGDKQIAIRASAEGGVVEEHLDLCLRHKSSLTAEELINLGELALQCLSGFGRHGFDMEWAIDENGLWLLQIRPLTA
ncbi:PEP/pyruvate-binding domain-containing protein [Martelella mangrovi]|uniref:Phosphoenolpyruvate synthase n=1 Tax=Martelella mangrovi TaxID=1397477 RepID=A0ABV2ICU2_9HYPH